MDKINLRFIGLCAIGAIFSGLIGFLIAAGNGVTFNGHDHKTAHFKDYLADNLPHADTTGHAKMHDTPIHLANNKAAPTIIAKIKKDPVSGFNLFLITTNFIFAPELSGLQHKDGTGHAHLYIDGQKIARLYGKSFHISEIPKGAESLEVTLNSNDHRPFFSNNLLISSIIALENER